MFKKPISISTRKDASRKISEQLIAKIPGLVDKVNDWNVQEVSSVALEKTVMIVRKSDSVPLAVTIDRNECYPTLYAS